MIEWKGCCQRCFKDSMSYTMSWFNEELVCSICSIEESKDPRYEEAKDEELKAVRSGNYNFKGIGYSNTN